MITVNVAMSLCFNFYTRRGLVTFLSAVYLVYDMPNIRTWDVTIDQRLPLPNARWTFFFQETMNSHLVYSRVCFDLGNTLDMNNPLLDD